MKLSPMDTHLLKKVLYRQTLWNRGTYAHGSDEQRKLILEMFNILVNKEKIERDIAKDAITDRIVKFYFIGKTK